jgi:proline racemase
MPTFSTGHITTIDSHTAGHPTRVVTGGLPALHGSSVAERMAYFEAHHDHLRTFLLHEPRGHAAMVGVVMTESSVADFGAFFLGSYKYLEMCGHASIGLAITLDHLGLVRPGADGSASVTVEVPAGVITLQIDYNGQRPARVTLHNVPAFVAGSGEIDFNGSPIGYDVVYGGNWYAIVEADKVGVDLVPSGVGNAMATGAVLKAGINADIKAGRIAGVTLPVDSMLFCRTENDSDHLVTRQLVILEANKFDRSPCGTGTSARLAQMIGRGQIGYGEKILSRNILDIDFEAVAMRDPAEGSRVLPRISGTAFITGHNSFLLQDGDPLDRGFLCR